MAEYSNELSQHIKALGSLSTPAKVIVQLIELAKDPNAELDAYVKLIQADASLSSKLLGLTNSARVYPRRSLRTIEEAVNLLGTSNVRALTMTHLLAGIYKHWELDDEDTRAYREASLCKAVVAGMLAPIAVPSLADEVFAIGLFQDIALGLFVATAGVEFAELLCDPRFTVKAQLRYEYVHFGVDHPTVGRFLGQKLGLPRNCLDAIRFHHVERNLASAVNDNQIARALHAVSFLPHDIRSWKPEDILHLNFAIKDLFPGRWASASAFIHDVEPIFSLHVTAHTQVSATTTSLVELMNKAYDENVQFAIPQVPQVSR